MEGPVRKSPVPVHQRTTKGQSKKAVDNLLKVFDDAWVCREIRSANGRLGTLEDLTDACRPDRMDGSPVRMAQTAHL